MPNALIYSFSFDGHRQIYVFILAHILNELGFKLFIAGSSKATITNSFYIDKLKENAGITVIDASNYSGDGLDITSNELIELQNKHKIDLTVFAEADHHISLFNSQVLNKKKKMRGRTVGIFLRPFYYYEQLSFLDKLRYLKSFSWKSNNFLFHEFFLKQFRLLDTALYLDENFVSNHVYSQWLPDVFQQFAENLVKDENSKERVWINKLNDFRENNKGRFIVLYFGTTQSRRGYDLLLKMAVEQNACFIHCGLRDGNDKYQYDVNELRTILSERRMLMETNQFMSDPLTIEHFFKTVNHLILPYRNFFGSSSVMLQALSYKIPVLVPDNGIMGYRVKKYNLGLTYNGSSNSLTEQLNNFKKIPKETFEPSITKYMDYQTPDQLKQVLLNVFGGFSKPIEHP